MAEKEVKLMKGNEVIAHAAIRYGCDGYFGYPITPQSEVMETLMELKPWETTGMVVLQAESEISSINMVYGAAGAGMRAMTSSSSPGISLKQEGITYLAAAELPCVIVNVMRGGPGLGTIQPGQGDYFQATRGGGNGDYGVICCDKRLTGGGGAIVCGEDRPAAWEFSRVKYTSHENHDYRINNFDAALWLQQRLVSDKLTARARKNLDALAANLDCVAPPTEGDAATYALTKAAGKIAELRAAGYSVKKPPLVHALPQYADCHYFEHEPHYSACRAFDDYCLISADMPALSRMKLIRMLKTACAAQHN